MSDKIPTADAADWQIRDYISKIVDSNCKEVPWEGTTVHAQSMKDEIMEFLQFHRKAYAELHVTAALEAAAENVHLSSHRDGSNEGTGALQFNNGNCYHVHINKDSILNAYPLTNIK